MSNTALISAPMGRSYYFVTLVNGEVEKTFTCRNLSEVISTINSNGVYNDSIESYDMTDKAMEQIKRKVNARPTPFIIASMGSESFCTGPSLTIESATRLAIECGVCVEWNRYTLVNSGNYKCPNCDCWLASNEYWFDCENCKWLASSPAYTLVKAKYNEVGQEIKTFKPEYHDCLISELSTRKPIEKVNLTDTNQTVELYLADNAVIILYWEITQ